VQFCKKKNEHLETHKFFFLNHVKNLEKKIVTPNSGKPIDEYSDRNQRRKLVEFKSKAQSALWFAQSYGLVPKSFHVSTDAGRDLKILFSDTGKKCTYQTLDPSEKQKIRDLSFVLDNFGVSDNAYHELSIFEQALPRKTQISQCREEIHKMFNFHRAVGNIPGAYVSITEELVRYINTNLSGEPHTLTVKISGDGSKVSRISNCIVMSFSVINSDDVSLSSLDQNVICIVNCKESFDHLKDACKPVFDEINELIKKREITVNQNVYPLQCVFGGDMKFLQIILGLGNSLSTYSCPWCKIHKDERVDLSKPFDFYQICLMDRTCENIQNDFISKMHGVKYSPLVKIDPDHVVPDELHLLLRICDKLLCNLIDDAKSLDDKSKVLREKSNKVADLVDKIRECGISFSIWTQKGSKGEIDWTSLSGSDYKNC